MIRNWKIMALAASLAATVPACTTGGFYGGGVYRHSVRTAFDEGFSRGLIDGRRAARRDYGHRDRRSFWNDPRYRRGTDGYRSHYGSRSAYADGFRAGYERGYYETRDRERGRRRY